MPHKFKYEQYTSNCTECDGTGWVTYMHDDGDTTEACPECNGTGEVQHEDELEDD